MVIKMNKYQKLKLQHQEESDTFGWKFANTEIRFIKMMNEWNLASDDIDKIYYLGNACFILAVDKPAYFAMKERHKKEHQQAIAQDATGNGYIYQMFAYELETHSFEFLHRLDIVLDTLDLTLEQINSNAKLKRGLTKALKKYES